MNRDNRNEEARKLRRQKLIATPSTRAEADRPGLSETLSLELSEHFGWTVVKRERVRDGTFPHFTINYCGQREKEKGKDADLVDLPILKKSGEDRILVSENLEMEQEPHAIEAHEELQESVNAISLLEEPVVRTTLDIKPPEKHLISKFFYKRSSSAKRHDSQEMRSEVLDDYYELKNVPFERSPEVGNGRGDANTLMNSEEDENVAKKRTNDLEERKARSFAKWAWCLGGEDDEIFLENKRRGMIARASSESRAVSKLISRLKYDPQKYGRGGVVSEELLASSERSIPNKYLYVTGRNKQTKTFQE